jgi:Rifampin ADP-ribosyl transferase
MSASDHLSPQQGAMSFYHGTTADLQPGDLIHSAAQRGTNGRLSTSRKNQHAYFTSDPVRAEQYSRLNATREKSYTYTVQPLGRVTPDRRHSAGQEGFKSKGPLLVTGRHETGKLDEEKPWWK